MEDNANKVPVKGLCKGAIFRYHGGIFIRVAFEAHKYLALVLYPIPNDMSAIGKYEICPFGPETMVELMLDSYLILKTYDLNL